MSTEQSNPPTSEILTNHELAWRTIRQHDTPLAIFDERELSALRRFVTNPSPETQRWLVEEYCGAELDPPGTPDQEVGQKVAAKSGSLVGYVVARWGRVEGDARTLTSDEIEEFRAWFEGVGGGVGEDAKL